MSVLNDLPCVLFCTRDELIFHFVVIQNKLKSINVYDFIMISNELVSIGELSSHCAQCLNRSITVSKTNVGHRDLMTFEIDIRVYTYICDRQTLRVCRINIYLFRPITFNCAQSANNRVLQEINRFR